ncbi:MAG: hypothetical protein QHI38_02965 [Armatimonadota bacterium]|nr:hypothetical protein [Armatimonadota bacterium]
MNIEQDSYTAHIDGDSISLFLGERRYLVLRVATTVNAPGQEDLDGPLSGPQVSRYEDGVEMIWTAASSVWERKTYQWRFEPDAVVCRVRVNGKARIDDVRFFTQGGRWSFFDFSRFFTPECSLLDQRYWKSMQYGCIDATQGQMSEFPVDENANNHWIFTPPPLCFSLGFSSGPWLGAGIAPRPGQYNFTRFEYRPRVWEFCFRLTYDGKTEVDGSWDAPVFMFRPAADEYQAISKYCDTLRAWKIVAENKHEKADWWSRPMFCGWGEQNVLATRFAKRPQDFASQEVYDRFIETIDALGLSPGTIIIDDKWQKHYGTCEVDTDKWPDIRGWIDARHAEGRRVLLWYGAWCPEGLDADECLIDAEGNPRACDPTSPKYQARVREMLRRMLSDEPGCCNADGIKYDWTGMPIDPALKPQGEQWGIELFKTYTKHFYDSAKAVKPDALIITHTANPYFAECTDMVRLNDIHAGTRELCDMMIHRQKIAKMACPHALIDCDNSSATTHKEWLEYMKLQPSLGVPSLYFLTALHPTGEPIVEDDWRQLAHIWRR